MNQEVLDKILSNLKYKLSVQDEIGALAPRGSIMRSKEVCNHDDGFLCEHRRDWIISYLRNEIELYEDFDGNID